eukprot:scaffold474557_cov40-Prasinocladus_malaysianus.AAC.1
MDDFMPFDWDHQRSRAARGRGTGHTHHVDSMANAEDEEELTAGEHKNRFGVFGRRFAQKLSDALNVVGTNTVTLGENIGRGALSATELLSDNELRKKGADVVLTGGRAKLNDFKKKLGTIQRDNMTTASEQVELCFFSSARKYHSPCLRHGFEASYTWHLSIKCLTKGIQGAGNGLASGPKQMQSVLARVQHRLHQQRLRILLRAAKDDPVDVQIGPQLYEDAPQ